MVPSEGGIPLFKDIDSIIKNETDSTTASDTAGEIESETDSDIENLE